VEALHRLTLWDEKTAAAGLSRLVARTVAK